MIYDTLNNLPNYLGVSDNLDTVIEYIMARDITTLPAGRTRIDGEKAVVTVSTVTPLTSDKALFQRHDNHITLETDLDGSELFEVSLAELTPTKPTDEATDTTVGTAGTSIAGMLCEGRFALYLAGEPYKSGLKAQGCGKLKKPCSASSWTRTKRTRPGNKPREGIYMGFFAVLAASLFAVFLFTVFGGYSLLLWCQQSLLMAVPPAVVLAVLVWTFLKMGDKITALQKRVEELESAQKNADKPEK